MKKLDAYSPIGFSCVAGIIEVDEGVTGFEVGYKVASAYTGYANRTEILSVPINLCAKLNKNSSLKDAVYITLGTISIQGVRQVDLSLGESCVVFVLLGQLAAFILKATGLIFICVDLSEGAVKQAIENQVVHLGSKKKYSIKKP